MQDRQSHWRAVFTICWVLGLASGCGDDGTLDPDSESDPDATFFDDGGTAPIVDAGPPPTPGSCEEIAATFQTLGSANADLADPVVSASCADDVVTVLSNGIPDFPYIATSPGDPRAADYEFVFPATPTAAAATTDIPIIGPIGVAVNGIPIYGPTEGAGGDVQSMPGGFVECGGHNGPTGYHYHLFLATGSDACRFSPEDGRVLYGYAFDGYPIYGGFDYTSSYELTDESLFATDTWAAHSYVEGSGDLDECNGLTDADGNYAYYATDAFPYLLGCFRGEPTDNGPDDAGGPGMMR